MSLLQYSGQENSGIVDQEVVTSLLHVCSVIIVAMKPQVRSTSRASAETPLQDLAEVLPLRAVGYNTSRVNRMIVIRHSVDL